jgi:hypothetical protein
MLEPLLDDFASAEKLLGTRERRKLENWAAQTQSLRRASSFSARDSFTRN